MPLMSGARSLSWMSRGACRQADPELFFPIGATAGPAARQVEAAKAVCGSCAVRANCLSYALEAMPEGIWGGTTLEERRTARRRLCRRQASAQSPGTVSAATTGESTTAAGQPLPSGRAGSTRTEQRCATIWPLGSGQLAFDLLEAEALGLGHLLDEVDERSQGEGSEQEECPGVADGVE
jgi:WhiB family transcriptional regulator, redox-sensing transcriptional regulator